MNDNIRNHIARNKDSVPEIGLKDGLVLKVADQEFSRQGYPTDNICKGFVLSKDGINLAEEGVGFGVPVIQRGHETIFPGEHEAVIFDKSGQSWSIVYRMNLVERLSSPKVLFWDQRWINDLKDKIASFHRMAPFLRKPLTFFSNFFRRLFDIKTVFLPATFAGSVIVKCRISPEFDGIDINVNTEGLILEKFQKLIIMNELGGNFFEKYREVGGKEISGKAIGTWDKVNVQEASFMSTSMKVYFSLAKVEGSLLFRGREIVKDRLAWSGFGYVFPSDVRSVRYKVIIGVTT